jgi:hypothetical protein
MPLQSKALADHWQLTTARVRQLRAERAMPAFEDLGADSPDRFKLADEWREANAPARRTRIMRTVTRPDPPDGIEAKTKGGGGASAPLIDLDAERAKIGDNYEEWVVAAVEKGAMRAVALYHAACDSGSDSRIANALTNMNEALRRAREQRESWFDQRERARTTITLDRAQEIIAAPLEALRRRLAKMGSRICSDANPEDPARAARAIDCEVDAIFTCIQRVLAAMDGAKHDLGAMNEGKAEAVA